MMHSGAATVVCVCACVRVWHTVLAGCACVCVCHSVCVWRHDWVVALAFVQSVFPFTTEAEYDA